MGGGGSKGTLSVISGGGRVQEHKGGVVKRLWWQYGTQVIEMGLNLSY